MISVAPQAHGRGVGSALMQASHAMDPRYPITDGLLFEILKTFGACGYIDGAPTGAVSADAFKGVNVTVYSNGSAKLSDAAKAELNALTTKARAQSSTRWPSGVRP